MKTRKVSKRVRDKTVKEVIANYKRYFKPIGPAPKGLPALKKVRIPLQNKNVFVE